MPRTEVKYGEPSFNLEIEITYPTSWDNESDHALKEKYQKAIMWAKGF